MTTPTLCEAAQRALVSMDAAARRGYEPANDALRDALAQQDEQQITGRPAGLLQDDCKGLSKALAPKPDSMRLAREAGEQIKQQDDPVAPIDMVLHCPACGMQHIDAPEDSEGLEHPDNRVAETWANPPHRSHMCHACCYIWRPADVVTNGVAAVKTVGKADSPTVTRQPAPVVPRGLAIVPLEMTHDMLRAPDYRRRGAESRYQARQRDWEAILAAAPKQMQHAPVMTYTSTQATNCAGCGEHKHTPLRIDAMGGYVCLTCIDRKLGSLLGEFGYQEPVAPMPLAERVAAVDAGIADADAQPNYGISWGEAEAVSNEHWVDQMIRNLLEDPTGDNATMVVREVARAVLALRPEAQPTPDDRMAEAQARADRRNKIGGAA